LGFFCQFYDIENLVIFPKISQIYTKKKNPNAFLEKNKKKKQQKIPLKKKHYHK
jgi:hypothetical protein